MCNEYVGNVDAAPREVNTQPWSFLKSPIYLSEGLSAEMQVEGTESISTSSQIWHLIYKYIAQ